MRTKHILMMAAVGMSALTSCQKEEGCTDETANNFNAEAEVACENCCTYNVAETTLRLMIEHEGNGSAFALNQTYTDDFGNDYRFTRLQYYMSGIALADGGNMIMSNEYLLVDPSQTAFDLGTVNGSGHYHDVMMTIGIDSATNHADPALQPNGHPLAFQTPSTHWSWSSGYIFIMAEGEVDADNDGTFEGTFLFHIGTDGYRQDLTLSGHVDVDEGVTNTIMLHADYTAFMAGIDMSTNPSTHTMNNTPLANQFIGNIGSVFSVH